MDTNVALNITAGFEGSDTYKKAGEYLQDLGTGLDYASQSTASLANSAFDAIAPSFALAKQEQNLAATQQQAATATDAQQKSVKGLTGEFTSLQGSISSVIPQASSLTGQVEKMSFGLEATVQAADNLNAALTDLTRIAQASQLDMGVLTTEIERMRDTFGDTKAAQARALFSIIESGSTAATTAVQQLEVANKLALASLVNVPQAATALASALAGYSKQGVTATEVANTLAAAFTQSQIPLADLSRNLASASIASANAGISLKELLAATQSLTTGQTKAYAAMSSVESVIKSISQPTQEARKAAAELGIQFDSSTLHAQGLSQFLAHLRTQLGVNSGAMRDLFQDTNAYNAVIALTGTQANKFKTAMEGMAKSTGVLDQAILANSNNAEVATQKLRTSIIDLQQEIDTTFSPIKGWLLGATTATTQLLKANREAAMSFIQIISAVTALGVAAKVTSMVFVGLSGVLGRSAAMYTMISVPILLAAAAFAALFYASNKITESQKNAAFTSNVLNSALQQQTKTQIAYTQALKKAGQAETDEIKNVKSVAEVIGQVQNGYLQAKKSLEVYVAQRQGLKVQTIEENNLTAHTVSSLNGLAFAVNNVANYIEKSRVANEQQATSWTAFSAVATSTILSISGASRYFYMGIINSTIAASYALQLLGDLLTGNNTAVMVGSQRLTMYAAAVNTLGMAYANFQSSGFNATLTLASALQAAVLGISIFRDAITGTKSAYSANAHGIILVTDVLKNYTTQINVLLRQK